MFGFLKRRPKKPDVPGEETLSSWMPGPSIYDHIWEHIPEENIRGLLDGGETLPDEVEPEDGISFAMGAMDGMFTHHFDGGNDPDAAAEILQALLAFDNDPTQEKFVPLYTAFAANNAISIVDVLLPMLAKNKDLRPQTVVDLAYAIAVCAGDREAVKTAIAILGIYEGIDVVDILYVLGRHDEFTLFVAAAFQSKFNPPDQELMNLADVVTGWGRINCVERLAASHDPDVQDWMLRAGFHNDVMPGYTALICAEAGRMFDALKQDELDEELLGGIALIIYALVVDDGDGPVGGMEELENSGPITLAFLDHLEKYLDEPFDYLVTQRIMNFERADWGPDTAKQIQTKCQDFLNRPQWPEVVQAGLKSEDDLGVQYAVQVAQALQIDIWPQLFELAQTKPTLWQEVLQTDKPARLAQVMDYARATLDLTQFTTGPTEALVTFGVDGVDLFSAILAAAAANPGQMDDFVLAGLKSPGMNTRSAAVLALKTWTKAQWPKGATAALTQAESIEPQAELKTEMQTVLNKK